MKSLGQSRRTGKKVDPKLTPREWWKRRQSGPLPLEMIVILVISYLAGALLMLVLLASFGSAPVAPPTAT
ncbi:MAG: hypothetical protein JW862_06855, partial [Anaerolineales bacterium]|nr:hypothetical protein [Anaerolineales bacterium]